MYASVTNLYVTRYSLFLTGYFLRYSGIRPTFAHPKIVGLTFNDNLKAKN